MYSEISVYQTNCIEVLFSATQVEYWPAGLPLLLHLSADGFQAHCQSYQPRPETQYLHMKNKVGAKTA